MVISSSGATYLWGGFQDSGVIWTLPSKPKKCDVPKWSSRLRITFLSYWTGLRGSSGLQRDEEDGAAQIGAVTWAEIAEAISQEQLHLERLELEMRR